MKVKLLFSLLFLFSFASAEELINPYVNPTTVNTNTTNITNLTNTVNTNISSDTVTAASLVVSTTALQTQVDEVKVSTGVNDLSILMVSTSALQTQLDEVKVSTGLLATSVLLNEVKVSTGLVVDIQKSTITVVQGTNITITNSGTVYTINSTASGGGVSNKTISFYVPGDAFVTTSIVESGRLGFSMTLTSATTTVGNRGTAPTGGSINFDIKHSSGSDYTPVSIFTSTNSLTILPTAKYGSTTAFAIDHLVPEDELFLDIGQIGLTVAGGSPFKATLEGTQR